MPSPLRGNRRPPLPPPLLNRHLPNKNQLNKNQPHKTCPHSKTQPRSKSNLNDGDCRLDWLRWWEWSRSARVRGRASCALGNPNPKSSHSPQPRRTTVEWTVRRVPRLPHPLWWRHRRRPSQQTRPQTSHPRRSKKRLAHNRLSPNHQPCADAVLAEQCDPPWLRHLPPRAPHRRG